jgi:hypothetical protein
LPGVTVDQKFIVTVNSMTGPVSAATLIVGSIPTVSGISPLSVAGNEASVVTITGTNFVIGTNFDVSDGTNAVTHGVTGSGSKATDCSATSATTIVCKTASDVNSQTHSFIVTIGSLSSAAGGTLFFLIPTVTPTPTPTPTPTQPAGAGSSQLASGKTNDWITSIATAVIDGNVVIDINALNGKRSAFLNCNQFNDIPSGAVVVEVALGIYKDYFKPAGGQNLCNLLTGPFGAFYLHSTSKTGPFAAVQSVDPRRLGGAGNYAGGAQGRSSTGNGAYPGIGPYWGVRTAGDPGACGHEAVGDAFHCGITATISVSVVNFYSRYAFINGFNVITESTYKNGVRPTAASADDVRACSDYDSVPFGNLIVKLTMGTFVDYIKPLQSLCKLLTDHPEENKPNTGQYINPWFYHAWSEDGPWKLTWGNHSALLGGWAVYGVDTDIVSHVDPDGSTVQRQRRVWGTFWGAPAINGYKKEPGACCHATPGQIYQFYQKLTIDIKVLSS